MTILKNPEVSLALVPHHSEHSLAKSREITQPLGNEERSEVRDCKPSVVLLLEAVGYVPNAEQTEAAKHGINFMVNMLPAILAFVSCIPLIWYKLDDKRVSEIRADLEAGKHAWDK